LGQARQEELLEYFMQEDMEQEQLDKLFINLSPYFKKYGDEQIIGLYGGFCI
jgi:hypothetical protein